LGPRRRSNDGKLQSLTLASRALLGDPPRADLERFLHAVHAAREAPPAGDVGLYRRDALASR